MHSVGGRLLFYRWPERHACLADAPGDVHEVAQRCSRAVVFFKIPHGYGRGSSDPDGPEDGTACAEYSLSAPTPEAAAVAQLRLRELLGAGPALCKTDSTGAPRAAVAWVEGGSPLQPVAGRVLELMDLVDRGDRDVVECLGRMVAKMKPRLAGANKARRRCHMDEQQVERALRQLRLDRPSAPNALLRDVLPVISQARLLEQPRPPLRSFAEALLDAESERAKYNLRPGFGDPGQSLQSAVPLLLEELSYEAGATLRSGKAQCPRTAYLSAPPKGRCARAAKGKGKGRQKARKPNAPQVSKLVMMKDRFELQCDLPRSNGKLSAIWIARYDAVEQWFSGGWRHGAKTPYALGVLRMVASASPGGRQVSVAPPVAALPEQCDGHPVPVPPVKP